MKLYQSLIMVPSEVLQNLATIAADPDTTVIVTTIHQRHVLERLLGHMNIVLAAENGCIYRNMYFNLLDNRNSTMFIT